VTALDSAAMMITTSRKVPMISLIRLAAVLRIAGPVEKHASLEPASGVCDQCGRKCSHPRIAPTNAPSNCAMKKGRKLAQLPLVIATASETAGLMCAPGLPHACATATPAITAANHPVAMTIQPELLPLVLPSTTLATTPLPNRIRTRVPMNSPMSCLSILFFKVPGLSGGSDSPKFGHAADFHPLAHEDVAVMIPGGSVRIHELARDELAAVFGGARRIAFFSAAHADHQLVVLVEDVD